MIGIIDYGMGNLHSVKNALDHLGLESLISSSPQELEECEKLILPGVGAFGDMKKRLEETGLWDFLHVQCRENEVPLLGICLGMQALFEESYEFGCHEGLGFLKGSVVEMHPYGVRIPAIGWNELHFSSQSPMADLFDHPVFAYYDHSYVARCDDPACLWAISEYGPYTVPGIVQNKNVIGCQFHPEKSGRDGLRLLEWFGKEFEYDSSACN